MAHRKLSSGAAMTVALVGALLYAGPVAAADLDAPLDPALEDPPQVMPSLPLSGVAFGSGWYVRGDAAVTRQFKVGVQQPTPKTFSTDIVSTGTPSYDLSLGGGYAFTNNFRADLTVDFFQPSQDNLLGAAKCPTGGRICTLVGQFNRYDALINGYYDIGTWSIATPYVGAGVGVAFGNVRATVYDKSPYQGYLGYHNLAFAGMAGVVFDVYPHVKLDVGYRYVNNGRVVGTEIYNHELRAGLRYMIDN